MQLNSFMVYAVETTEDFDREFKRKHKDKSEWLEKIKEKLKDSPEYGKPLKGDYMVFGR